MGNERQNVLRCNHMAECACFFNMGYFLIACIPLAWTSLTCSWRQRHRSQHGQGGHDDPSGAVRHWERRDERILYELTSSWGDASSTRPCKDLHSSTACRQKWTGLVSARIVDSNFWNATRLI